MKTRRELKALSKKQIKGNIFMLFVLELISGLVLTLCYNLRDFFTFNRVHINVNNFKDSLIKYVTYYPSFPQSIFFFAALSMATLLVLFVYPPLRISICRVYLDLTEGVKPKIEKITEGFKKCWLSSVGLFLLEGILEFLWSLLLIIPGIIKCYSYSMASFILIENPEISPLEAITRSKDMMKGHKFELFVLDLSFIWWYLAIIFTLGIASIYVTPYIISTRTNFYLNLKADNEPQNAAIEA